MTTLTMKHRIPRRGKKRVPAVKVHLPATQEKKQNTESEDSVGGGSAPSRFFWFWFGIPFLLLLVVGWIMGHS